MLTLLINIRLIIQNRYCYNNIIKSSLPLIKKGKDFKYIQNWIYSYK
jgi:hypothetical protein